MAQPSFRTHVHDAQDVKNSPAKVLPKPAVDAAKPAETPHRKIAEEPVKEPVKPPVKETAVPDKDSGQLYTVVKGDNSVTIAKKFHVSSADLLKINKIDDPKKLQIGQKLRIPAKIKNL